MWPQTARCLSTLRPRFLIPDFRLVSKVPRSQVGACGRGPRPRDSGTAPLAASRHLSVKRKTTILFKPLGLNGEFSIINSTMD